MQQCGTFTGTGIISERKWKRHGHQKHTTQQKQKVNKPRAPSRSAVCINKNMNRFTDGKVRQRNCNNYICFYHFALFIICRAQSQILTRKAIFIEKPSSLMLFFPSSSNQFSQRNGNSLRCKVICFDILWDGRER